MNASCLKQKYCYRSEKQTLPQKVTPPTSQTLPFGKLTYVLEIGYQLKIKRVKSKRIQTNQHLFYSKDNSTSNKETFLILKNVHLISSEIEGRYHLRQARSQGCNLT